MNQSIYPCLTIKDQIAEAADFYINTFGNGSVSQSMPFVIQIELSGQKFLLLNEGPESSPNPSVSFMVFSASAEETERYYNKLNEGGMVLMPLDSYDWSSRYAWVQDKYGISWQLYTGSEGDIVQKFCPTLMFTGQQAGKAWDALNFYTSVFSQSSVHGILKYSETDGDNPDYIKHSQFTIKDYVIMAMDSGYDHKFGFVDAVSLVVECEDQEEIDRYWSQLTSNGGSEVACGWLTDKFGVSWQIIPRNLINLVTDSERSPRVMTSMMKMVKLNLAELESA